MKRSIVTVAALIALALPAVATAQGLPAQLSPTTRDTLQRLIDSARAAHLPWEPLTSKAAEGVLKAADEPRILRAVRQLERELRTAASILPPGSLDGTISAGASALHSGASFATLQRLAALHPHEQDLAVALVALADLMANHVPADLAGSSIEELVKRHANDADIAAFRSSVAREIAGGQSPGAAATAGVRDAVHVLDARPGTPAIRPGAKPPDV